MRTRNSSQNQATATLQDVSKPDNITTATHDKQSENASRDSAVDGSLSDEIEVDWTQIQMMHECEKSGWNGGDLFYDGPHDSFCFACGGTMELFGCQTCENCYHAECMTPSLDTDQVPTFWFCPHCVDRELHIPPAITPLLDPEPAYPSPTSVVGTIGNAAEELVIVSQSRDCEKSTVSNAALRLEHGKAVPDTSLDKHAPKSVPQTTGEVLQKQSSKTKRPRRSYSPPRKKSKYSTFSIEVDKALAVLHSELETAAKYGKSEDNLQNKVQDLEQTLKLQDGQMKLSTKELESLRKRFADERVVTTRLMSENVRCRDEIRRLSDMVQQKDAELKDWRAKLRTMMGSELD